MVEEIWKPVKGYEGFYEVSNTGKVRSVDREITLKGKRSGQTRMYKGRLISPLNCGDGHLNIHLQREGHRKNIGLGRLVALHFLDGFEDSGRYQICYKDGDHTNCTLDNLYFTPTGSVVDGNDVEVKEGDIS